MAAATYETPEERRYREALPPTKLMGYCDHCSEWYKFDSEKGSSNCPTCGGKHSHRIGYQLTTQRSFDPAAKKMTKAALKKMSGQR